MLTRRKEYITRKSTCYCPISCSHAKCSENQLFLMAFLQLTKLQRSSELQIYQRRFLIMVIYLCVLSSADFVLVHSSHSTVDFGSSSQQCNPVGQKVRATKTEAVYLAKLNLSNSCFPIQCQEVVSGAFFMVRLQANEEIKLGRKAGPNF